nr:innexin inx2-like isoform X2 [Dermatophagoides farinae]
MFDELRALFSFLQRRSLSIDGLVFGIVCRMTAILMLAGLVVVCSNQLIGKLINCDASALSIESEFLNTFCLIHTTYIVYEPSTSMKKSTSNSMTRHNGIFPGIRLNRVQDQSHQLKRSFIEYYHWLWMIYFVGGLWFYFPHWLWKKLECRRIRSLVSHADMLVDHQHNQSSEYIKLKRIANYVVTSFGSNDRYMWGYYFCEIIAFTNLFAQMYTLNLIFDGRYLSYGIDAVQIFWHSNYDRDLNPINMIFPRMTKCEYRRYGPSGAWENLDSLSQTFWPKMRSKFLCDLLMKSSNCENDPAMIDLLTKLRMSDWFFLNLIANNVDRLFLVQLLAEISIIIKKRSQSIAIKIGDDDVDVCILDQQQQQHQQSFPDPKSSSLELLPMTNISISGHH